MILKNPMQWSGIVKEALNGTLNVAKFFCLLHVTNAYVVTNAVPYGPSMLPTLNLTGDLVLADRISIRFGMIRNGDIVLVRSPENPRKIMIKRVMGMEGDPVTYAAHSRNGDRRETIVVPKGHVWVEGDSTYMSHDSRHFGPVPYGLVHGKVFWRIWPPKAFGPLGRRGEQDDVSL